MTVIPYTNEAEWHILRRWRIGASEVSALFGCQPAYAMSKWTLWQVLSGRMERPDVSGNRPESGLYFENAGAHWLAQKHGFVIRKFPGYAVYDEALRLGASPDYEIVHDQRGPGLLEFKWIDWLQHKRVWGDEPPLHILLQLQTQLACTGYGWGIVGTVIGGNDPVAYTYERRPDIIAEIVRRAIAFSDSIEHDIEPPIDGSDSTAHAVATLFGHDDGEDEPANMVDDRELPRLCAQYLQHKEAERVSAEVAQQARSAILARIQHHRAVYCDGFTIRAPRSKDTPDKLIMSEMVGKTIKGCAGSRRLTIKEFDA